MDDALAIVIVPVLLLVFMAMQQKASVPARSGTAKTGGTPTKKPAQQAQPGQAQTTQPDVAIVVNFWSDQYSYQQGSTIELSGFVYAWDGHVATRLSGRTVQIVDPDTPGNVDGGTAWLSAITGDDGSYRIDYTGNEDSHWRSFAIDVASGATTGTLDFYPQPAAQVGDSSVLA